MLHDVYDVFTSVTIFILGLIVISLLRKYFFVSLIRAWSLYLWHTMLCIAYAIFILNYGGDAYAYYLKSIELDSEHYLFGRYFGTGAVVHILAPFTQFLKFNFLASCLIFNIFGSVALVCFYGAMKSVINESSLNVKRFCSILIILPSISFWSSGVGKDALSFMSVCLICWSSLNVKNRLWLLVFSIFIMLLVRPHIAGLITIALFMSLAFNKSLPVITRLFLIIISSGSAVIMIPFALNYAGVEGGPSLSTISDYVDHRQTLNSQGGSSLDISSMTYPEQVFSYLFRPLPFEINSITTLLSSLENVILLLMFSFSLMIYFKVKARKVKFDFQVSFFVFYILGSLTILATTTANLGIAVRQKWMVMPFIILISLTLIKTYFKVKNERN
ncbi:hypothetical protein AB4320_24200 [Vibrio splendidus]